MNRTVQEKLGKWMVETKSRAWSVGCKIVKWQIISSHTQSIGMSPYFAVFGQKPRADLAHLPLSKQFLDQLRDESQLCAAFHLPEDKPFDPNASFLLAALAPPRSTA